MENDNNTNERHQWLNGIDQNDWSQKVDENIDPYWKAIVVIAILAIMLNFDSFKAVF